MPKSEMDSARGPTFSVLNSAVFTSLGIYVNVQSSLSADQRFARCGADKSKSFRDNRRAIFAAMESKDSSSEITDDARYLWRHSSDVKELNETWNTWHEDHESCMKSLENYDFAKADEILRCSSEEILKERTLGKKPREISREQEPSKNTGFYRQRQL